MKTHFSVALFLLTVVLLMAVAEKENALYCPDDLSAYCKCRAKHGQQVLTCNASTDEEFNVIRRKLNNASEIDFLQVTIVMMAKVIIPDDVLGAIETEHLILSCSDRSTSLSVHADAFRSTKNNTKTLTIQDCDLTKTSFAFLSQFPIMYRLSIKSSSIKEVLDMPYLPQLKDISFYGSTSLEKWYKSSQTPNLEWILLGDMPDLDDGKMDSILSSMTEKFIYPKLEYLFINKNSLTRVPPLVSTFPALISLGLGRNPIKTLPLGSIQKGSTQLMELNLSGTGLTTIEPGAFVGNFSSTNIRMDNNAMTIFSSSVFKDLLQSMVNHVGSLDISENPIAFDCNLKWLLIDNRDLLLYVKNGAIANGTLFKYLNSQELIDC